MSTISRITKAYGVTRTQDVLQRMMYARSKVRNIYISVGKYINVVMDDEPLRYAGELSGDVRNWLGDRTAIVYQWNITGGELFFEGGTKPQKRLYGLNLAIRIQADADSQTEAQDIATPEGQQGRGGQARPHEGIPDAPLGT